VFRYIANVESLNIKPYIYTSPLYTPRFCFFFFFSSIFAGWLYYNQLILSCATSTRPKRKVWSWSNKNCNLVIANLPYVCILLYEMKQRLKDKSQLDGCECVCIVYSWKSSCCMLLNQSWEVYILSAQTFHIHIITKVHCCCCCCYHQL